MSEGNDYGFTEADTERFWGRFSAGISNAISEGRAKITKRSKKGYDADDCIKLALLLHDTQYQTRTVQQLADELGWGVQRTREALKGADLVKGRYEDEGGYRVASSFLEVYTLKTDEHDSPVVLSEPAVFVAQALNDGKKVELFWAKEGP